MCTVSLSSLQEQEIAGRGSTSQKAKQFSKAAYPSLPPASVSIMALIIQDPWPFVVTSTWLPLVEHSMLMNPNRWPWGAEINRHQTITGKKWLFYSLGHLSLTHRVSSYLWLFPIQDKWNCKPFRVDIFLLLIFDTASHAFSCQPITFGEFV